MEYSGADTEVSIKVNDKIAIGASLSVPPKARGIVLFAHGSGSGRFSPRNRYVASELHRRLLATILIDLLTEREEGIDALTRELRFNIPLLTERVVGATNWLGHNDQTKGLRIGYFGASTGAAAALAAAAAFGERISAVVSRGGRPDLAQDKLPAVKAATLLIVGGNDPVVRDLNQKVLARLGGPKELAVVPGASHLFEEPGKLEEVAELAGEWFDKYVGQTSPGPSPTVPRR